MKNKITCINILLLVIITTNCQTVEEPAPDPTPTPTVTETETPSPTVTATPEPTPTATLVPATPTPENTPTPFPTAENGNPNVSTAEVSEEVFEKTFQEIEDLIYQLNTIVKAGDYQGWQNYLTSTYIEDLSNPETLADYSQKPILKKYNIVLKNLEDYFKYVVVPSRSNAKLDDLIFVNENRIKAIMIIGNQPIILYLLEKIDDQWFISIW